MVNPIHTHSFVFSSETTDTIVLNLHTPIEDRRAAFDAFEAAVRESVLKREVQPEGVDEYTIADFVLECETTLNFGTFDTEMRKHGISDFDYEELPSVIPMNYPIVKVQHV